MAEIMLGLTYIEALNGFILSRTGLLLFSLHYEARKIAFRCGASKNESLNQS